MATETTPTSPEPPFGYYPSDSPAEPKVVDERPASPGEMCACGKPAVTIFVISDGSETPYCGVPYGRATEPDRPTESPIGTACLLKGCGEPAVCELTFAYPSMGGGGAGRPQKLCLTHIGAVARDYARTGGGDDQETVTLTITPIGDAK